MLTRPERNQDQDQSNDPNDQVVIVCRNGRKERADDRHPNFVTSLQQHPERATTNRHNASPRNPKFGTKFRRQSNTKMWQGGFEWIMLSPSAG